jgi:nucleotide-binding universal stress UspA family protein
MGRYKNILIAIDESESSHNAVNETLKFVLSDTQTEQIKLTALTAAPAFDGEFGILDLDKVWDSVCQPCKAALAYAGKTAKDSGLEISTVCLEGDPYQKVVDYAHDNDCDLIVMGRRGLSRLERALMGSVTSRVIGYSIVDVLAVPRDAKVGFGKILLAVDGSKCSNNATRRAVDLATSYGGSLMIISTVDASNPRNEQTLTNAAEGFVTAAKDFAGLAGVVAETYVVKGRAFEVVTNFAKERGAEAIVVGSHGRTGLMRLIMGSVTEKIIGHAHCPVLVTR